jgi:hypothetical protein
VSSVLEFPCPRNEEFIGHSQTISAEHYFVFHIVVFFAVIWVSPDIESLTLIRGEAYLNGACVMNVDWSQFSLVKSCTLETHLMGWLLDP